MENSNNQEEYQLIDNNRPVIINHNYNENNYHKNISITDKIINTITNPNFLYGSVFIVSIVMIFHEKHREDTKILKEILNNVKRLK